MDMEKVWNKLMEDETIKNIPLKDIISVAIAVFSIINSGECYYTNE